MSDISPSLKRTALEFRLKNVSKRFGDVVARSPSKRGLGMMIQNCRLIPHVPMSENHSILRRDD